MKSTAQKTATACVALLTGLLTLSLAGISRADDDDGEGWQRARVDPLHAAECGGCHLAYPPRLLPAAAWRQIMSGLDNHFGTDASLEDVERRRIEAYLVANAGRGAALDGRGRPVLRISETAWFRREHRSGHDGLTADVFASAAVGSAANCGACHRGAANGDYGEGSIQLPVAAARN